MAAPIPSSIGDVRSQYLDDKSRVGSRDNSIFNTQHHQKNKIASLLRRDDGETNNYSHLSDFLKSHIYRSKDKMMHKQMKSLDNDDTFSNISKKNKYNNALIEKASLEIRERRLRESGSKRAQSHASGSLTNSESNLEKLQSAFLLGRERGGGDETSNNVKSNNGEIDPTTLSDKKASSIAQSRAAQSYLSNRLSRQRGGGRGKTNPTMNTTEVTNDRVSVTTSIKSGNRKLNSQGGKRGDILSGKR